MVWSLIVDWIKKGYLKRREGKEKEWLMGGGGVEKVRWDSSDRGEMGKGL